MSAKPWINSAAPRIVLPDLAGKIAVVTGCSRGIGLATSRMLIENGATVIGIARNPASHAQNRFIPLPLDLANVESIRDAFEKLAVEITRLDFIVNVAGSDPKYSIESVTTAEWDGLIQVNLRAYYFLIKHALPLLRKGQGKSIVNISSINYRLGIPGRAPYSTTKAGILGLTTGLCRELGREGIRINTISPGWVFTERQVREYFSGEEEEKNLAYLDSRQALKLQICSEDIANHILFYLSEFSRASSGHNCVVDGGWLLE